LENRKFQISNNKLSFGRHCFCYKLNLDKSHHSIQRRP